MAPFFSREDTKSKLRDMEVKDDGAPDCIWISWMSDEGKVSLIDDFSLTCTSGEVRRGEERRDNITVCVVLGLC